MFKNFFEQVGLELYILVKLKEVKSNCKWKTDLGLV